MASAVHQEPGVLRTIFADFGQEEFTPAAAPGLLHGAFPSIRQRVATAVQAAGVRLLCGACRHAAWQRGSAPQARPAHT